MSTHIDTISARAARDEDELEGSLLPVATQIADEPNSTNPAVPVAHFHYDTAIAVERHQQQENIAYTIPQNEKAAVADDSRSRIKFAQSKGLIASEEENEAVRNMNRQVFSKDYFSKQALLAANQNAKARNAQGLQITENPKSVDNERAASREKSNNQEAPKKQEDNHVVGYDVREYNVGTDYQMSDYDVQEYKSVYD
jgi:hypothetical protein